jgi:hypothetical protein
MGPPRYRSNVHTQAGDKYEINPSRYTTPRSGTFKRMLTISHPSSDTIVLLSAAVHFVYSVDSQLAPLDKLWDM